MSDQQHFLDKEFEDYSQEDWIQFVKFIEELGGSKFLKDDSGLDAAAKLAVESADAPLRDLEADELVKIRVRGPLVTVHTSKAFRGRGGGKGNIRRHDSNGKLTTKSESELRTTNAFSLSDDGTNLRIIFRNGLNETGRFVGESSGRNGSAVGNYDFL